MNRICVVGQGYVGLVSAAGLAELGNRVVGLDVDVAKIARLRRGEIPISEPGLDELVARGRADGRLRFTTDYAEAVAEADLVFLAVPTPEGPTGGADLTYLRSAALALAPHLRRDAVVVVKSTVPPGTADMVAGWLTRQRADSDPVQVVSHPEFLREGSAIEDFFRPDRVVVGAVDRAAAERVAALYTDLGCPALTTDRRTAEMIKYASNAFLATKISFINEMAQICQQVGADVKQVAHGMGLDRRIGTRFLEAGLGYGGSCFPKDVKALEHLATNHGGHPQLLRAVMEVNRAQQRAAISTLRQLLGGLPGRTVGLLGLAFKPNTDDLRGATAIALARLLLAEDCRVVAYDPVAMDGARRVIPDVLCCPDPYRVAALSHAVVLVTEWDEFRALDLIRLREAMPTPILLDGRNFFDPVLMRELGFLYVAIGRGRSPIQPGIAQEAPLASQRAREAVAASPVATAPLAAPTTNGHKGANGHDGNGRRELAVAGPVVWRA
ncbi:MAG TPA: UDP-glucose/GDP-mannose dehydrogenase family protein [Chloroflexota bacterium]|nr:UDP-glucose/GDP-mannose dehydrogenase family protein [Chloroflexota bacterium]